MLPVPSPRRRAWAILFLAATVIYVPGFWWGAPSATASDRVQSWGVDDATPLGPLAEVYGLFYPQPERNLGYPLLHPFLVACAYAPYMAWLLLTGGFGHPSGVFPFGLKDPVAVLRHLTWIAHFVSVLCGAGIVVAVYEAARALWDEATGRLAALLAALAYPMFYYARAGNVDEAATFFWTASLAAAAISVESGLTLARASWLGLFAGCALATKETVAAALAPLPIVPLFAHRPGGRIGPAWTSREFSKACLGGLAVAALALGLGSGMFLDPERFFAHLRFARERLAMTAAGEVAYTHHFPRTLTGNLGLAGAMWQAIAHSLGVPGAVLALLGSVAVMSHEWRKA
jgi:hypothetical protein